MEDINYLKGQSTTKKAEGSITVFLSLILLLIMSLLFTIIEGARISIAKVNAERALTTAADSVLAEFYGPLWKEYHVFGLDTSQDNTSLQEVKIGEQLKNYMSYTFLPNRDMDEKLYENGLELYDISVDSLSVEDKTLLTDYQGELLINEAVEYMKYCELGNGTELLLDKMSLLESPGKVSVIYEEKQKVEEELVGIDEGILDLMELLDGVKTGKKGIELRADGTLKTATYFVKKICRGTISKETVGINQEDIFLSLKDSYINPLPDIEVIEDNFTRLEETIRCIEGLEAEYDLNEVALTEAIETLEELNTIEDESEDESEEVEDQIENAENLIKELEDKRDLLQTELGQYETKKQTLISAIIVKKQGLSALISEIIPIIDSAKTTINNILEKTAKAEPLLKEYEENLYKSQEDIGEDIFSGMVEELNELKRYTSEDELGYNFTGMKQILENNSSVLLQAEGLLNQGEQELLLGGYGSAEGSFRNAGNFLGAYQIEGLTLDYSSLVLQKDDNLNPLGMVGNLIEEGITGLVMDADAISEAELTEELLPSVIAAMNEEKGGFISNLTAFFEEAAIGGRNSGMANLFGDFGEGKDALSMMGDATNSAGAHLLFQEYLREHFYKYPKAGEDIKTRRPSVLDYEQEYLLVGDNTDKENLSSVISRIIFVRTILDFVSILGDKAKREEAQLAAAALVGFTGLPILVSITKTLILLIWAFAEALVDTGALMRGKDVPILKKNLVLTFPELFLINHSFIEQKAPATVKDKELSLSYQDYLRIFLFIKNKKELAYRSMDLMQENIRIRYETDNFSINNCLFGFKTKARFLITSKFTGIAYVQKQIGSHSNSFSFETEIAYSY